MCRPKCPPNKALSGLISIILVLATAALGQSTLAEQMSTAEHLSRPGWWPTKTPANRDEYVGTAVCAKCHSTIAAKQVQTSMARTAMRAADSEILQQYRDKSFDLGPYLYGINSDLSAFRVTREGKTMTQPIDWALGSGRISQVFLGVNERDFHESRFSYFPPVKGFDYTSGQSREPSSSLQSAVGRKVDASEIRGCFRCHTTAVTDSDYSKVVPGVACESCHGPGLTHAVAMQSGQQDAAGTILNPGRLSPVDAVDFCGACHRTTVDVELQGEVGLGTVRFPAFRLQLSRCWGDGDKRITCMACHDPHEEVRHDLAYYDKKCLACHLSQGEQPRAEKPGKACPVGTSQCSSCHMPKFEIPDFHVKFTDHQISIAKK